MRVLSIILRSHVTIIGHHLPECQCQRIFMSKLLLPPAHTTLHQESTLQTQMAALALTLHEVLVRWTWTMGISYACGIITDALLLLFLGLGIPPYCNKSNITM
mmetsp:Transcript_30533/g.56030  ORF Transcript_30533/g.56030 Transcript_30533/m.56030 type:complete len:103 (-) Transcript_30533:193-501(-)